MALLSSMPQGERERESNLILVRDNIKTLALVESVYEIPKTWPCTILTQVYNNQQQEATAKEKHDSQSGYLATFTEGFTSNQAYPPKE
jgi:hypothetical protein